MSNAKVIPFPDLSKWESEGLSLGERERSSRSLMWDIGDWWNRGKAYGERAQIVTAPDWTGPKHGTCRNAGRIADRWEVSRRRDTLTFEHYAIVAALSDDIAIPLLQWCDQAEEPPRSTLELTARIKQLRRDNRERELADATEEAARTLGSKLYGVIYADPPWRFKPYSEKTGSDRAADNHYPTMTIDDIAEIEPPSATDCVLFLWVTVPMLALGIKLMQRWGFEYKSACAWDKVTLGTGYWFRNQLELLLIGTRGNVPAPAMGSQPPQVQSIKRGRHSAKPDEFADMIAAMFPHTPKLEMFARKRRDGWDTWGNDFGKGDRQC
jgi:N6-adenosine-specific RNA methylase IME4